MIDVSEHDKDVAEFFILYNLLISVLEIDQKNIESSPLRLKRAYIKEIEDVIQAALKAAKFNRIEMNKLGIKVFEKEDINEDFIRYPYLSEDIILNLDFSELHCVISATLYMVSCFMKKNND